MSDKERAANCRKNKKTKESLEDKNIKTEYDIECFALEKANETYMNIKNKLLMQSCNSDHINPTP